MIKILFGSDNYGAKDANMSLGRLMSAGVCMTKGTDTLINIESAKNGMTVNSVSTLNYNACKVASVVNGYIIGKGVAVMPSGAVVVLKEQYSFNADKHVSYVYLTQDIADGGQPVKIAITETPPSMYDVPLARIDNGEITDMRIFSSAKTQIKLTSYAWTGTYDFGRNNYDAEHAFNHSTSGLGSFSYCFLVNQCLVSSDDYYIEPVRLTQNYQLIGLRGYYKYYAKREGYYVIVQARRNTQQALVTDGECKIFVY